MCPVGYNYNDCYAVILHHILFTHLTGHHTLWTPLYLIVVYHNALSVSGLLTVRLELVNLCCNYCKFLIWEMVDMQQRARMEAQSGPSHAYWIQNHLIWNLASRYNIYNVSFRNTRLCKTIKESQNATCLDKFSDFSRDAKNVRQGMIFIRNDRDCTWSRQAWWMDQTNTGMNTEKINMDCCWLTFQHM